MTKSAAAKKAKSDAIKIKKLQERVNPLHREVKKIGEAYERACDLPREWKKDVEILKRRLLQVEQQLAKFEHDLALTAMEVEVIKVE